MKRVYLEKRFKVYDPLSLGKEYEAELNSKKFRRYQGTLHRVIPLEFDEATNLYKCKLCAFDVDDIDWYDREQIHEIPDNKKITASRKWRVNDKVRIQMKNRTIKGEPLDGHAKTIWVKAEIKDILDNNFYVVEHENWEKEQGVKKVVIHGSQINIY